MSFLKSLSGFTKFFKSGSGIGIGKGSTNKRSTQGIKLPNNGIPENFKVNIKGQRIKDETDGPRIDMNRLDREIYGKDDGSVMLESKIRRKVWTGLFFVFCYFFLLYKLFIYRLHADDLDIMEREVNEEVKLKKKVEEFKKSNFK